MQCIAGVDISKDHLDVSFSDTNLRRFTADTTGRRQLVHEVRRHGIGIVVFEATGGLERQLKLHLQRAGIEYRCVNPRRIRQFAQSSGRLAKTDALDAHVIREYGIALSPPARPETSERMIEQQELLARRDQLMGARSAERCRRQQVLNASVRSSIDRCLDRLEKELKQIEKQLARLLESDETQAGLGRALRKVDGVGRQTVNAMLVRLPELGCVSRKHIAALVGVAPMNDDSGRHRGQRTIKGGRREVRRVLYMAALVSIRCNPVLRRYYLGLVERGKRFKVAIVACMRKLLIHLNTIAADYYQRLVQPC